MSNCEEYLSLIQGHLDGALSEADEAKLQAHLCSCESCRALLSAYEEIDAGIGDLAEEPPEGLCRGVMYQIEQENHPKKRRFFFGPGTGIAAVAAVLILLVGTGKLQLPGRSTTATTADTTVSEAASADMAPEAAPEENIAKTAPSAAAAFEAPAEAGGAESDVLPSTAAEIAPEAPTEDSETEESVEDGPAAQPFGVLTAGTNAEAASADGAVTGPTLTVSGLDRETFLSCLPTPDGEAYAEQTDPETGDVTFTLPADILQAFYDDYSSAYDMTLEEGASDAETGTVVLKN